MPKSATFTVYVSSNLETQKKHEKKDKPSADLFI